MFSLSDDIAQEIRSFAEVHNLSALEIALILKGETKLLPPRIVSSLPAWHSSQKGIEFIFVFDSVSRILSISTDHFLKEAEKLTFFLNQDAASVIPLSKVQIQKIQKEIGAKVFNFVMEMVPEKYESRTLSTTFAGVINSEISTITGTIDSWKKPSHSKAPWNMNLNFDGKRISAAFFGKVGNSYSKQFPEGSEVIISGEINRKSVIPSFVNPEIFKYDEMWKELLSGIVPVYHKIQGVSRLFVLRAMREIILRLMRFSGDWLPPFIVNRYNFQEFVFSLINLHFPSIETPLDLLESKETLFHQRIAFDKLFFFQYGAWKQRRELALSKERAVITNSSAAKTTEENLPFPLTAAQQRVLKEIRADLSSKEPMSRLLQGDVGSGKTVVMLLAALDVVASGFSVAIMAPTEILARQHYESITKFTNHLNLKIEFLAGGLTGKKKETRLKEVHNADIIIGTHALFENLSMMEHLGFIIIDEQHRFGVSQRMELMSKAKLPDTLVVSATPIPRSLALTMYGGIDISVLNEMPPGRSPIKTKFVSNPNREKVVDYIVEIVNSGKIGYWVCPLVEESEKLLLTDVTNVFEEFKAKLEDKVQLLHGRMKGEEKERIITMLRTKEAGLLVSTVVVEVGVDIPEASFMVIENAERFGMAQLHQLRGRVGRGKIKSFCALISGKSISEKAEERLKFMESTQDGFKIAEFDLKKRGPGALTGFEQSGFRNDPYFLLAAQYGITVQKARNAVKSLFETDELSEREKKYIDTLFNKFFKERYDRYNIG